ncbi:serine hydrolase domain-containing protein [Spongiimicrobium sp. 3-5]|uniref:serine hydrolase domain-containing protein n=1 Tax=Spongiimicrobium sp. 3-5 TaxID=3332596 RepID=UPI00397EBF4F
MKIFKRVLVLLIVLLVAAVAYNYPKLNIISGFAAKNMASSIFIANRTEQSIAKNDNNFPLIKLATANYDPKGTSANVFGLKERTAICRDGLGCALAQNGYQNKGSYQSPSRANLKNNLPFPYGNNGTKDTVFAEINYNQLQEAVDYAFSVPEARTRTVLVAYKNRIISEKYIDGFGPDTKILGWSMTKSVLATLYGILEYQGKLDINNNYPFKTSNDEGKAKITLNHLLRMQSGLEWDEDYGSMSDVNRMLFLEDDMTKPQAEKDLIAAPGEVWYYSSGTSNLLSGILRKHFVTYQEYLDFPYTALIDKIGMQSMLIETDLAGNFVGSSYAWANTRDWAKFGLLYLNNGLWNGEQLFDERWVDYVTSPTPGSAGTYGGHFWLNAHGKYPDVPRDLFSANGFQGQRVFIIPSKELVVVRTGLAEGANFDVNSFLANIIASIN